MHFRSRSVTSLKQGKFRCFPFVRESYCYCVCIDVCHPRLTFNSECLLLLFSPATKCSVFSCSPFGEKTATRAGGKHKFFHSISSRTFFRNLLCSLAVLCLSQTVLLVVVSISNQSNKEKICVRNFSGLIKVKSSVKFYFVTSLEKVLADSWRKNQRPSSSLKQIAVFEREKFNNFVWQ